MITILCTKQLFRFLIQAKCRQHNVLSVDIASVLQEKVVLDESGQIEFRDHLVYPAAQEAPESAA